MIDVRRVRRGTISYPAFAYGQDGREISSFDDVREAFGDISDTYDLSMASDVFVLLATIPSRRTHFLQLVDALQIQQTVLPKILLLGDGYATLKQLHEKCLGQGRHAHVEPTPKGAGNRWRWASNLNLPKGSIVISIDDDQIPTPWFVERTAKELRKAASKRALTWAGWDRYKILRAYTTPGYPEMGIEMRTLRSGGAAIYAEDLKGLADHPESDALLGLGGDDDLMVSVHLRRNGVQLFRPAGPAPLFCSLMHHDAAAQHRAKHPHEIEVIRDKLLHEVLA